MNTHPHVYTHLTMYTHTHAQHICICIHTPHAHTYIFATHTHSACTHMFTHYTLRLVLCQKPSPASVAGCCAVLDKSLLLSGCPQLSEGGLDHVRSARALLFGSRLYNSLPLQTLLPNCLPLSCKEAPPSPQRLPPH
jgi:hypothetical protein